jgi:uncharacterized protein (TIGR02599 family)
MKSSFSGSLSRIVHGRNAGFTLIELLLSMTILAVLMTIVTSVIGLAQGTWARSNSRVSQFREARMAFDAISRNLSQATLNTYWQNEFDELGADTIGEARQRARNYVRESELQFVSGRTSDLLDGANAVDYPGHAVFFQAPIGVTNLENSQTENMVALLCGRGYFVSWGDDLAFRPPFLSSVGTVRPRFRYRLMEYSPPAEENRIYDQTLRPVTEHSKQWFQDAYGSVATAAETAGNRAVTRPIAENIIALFISPQVEDTGSTAPTWIAPGYAYDSTQRDLADQLPPQGIQHRLPPLVKLVLVAIDHASAERLAESGGDSPNLVGSSGAPFTSAAKLEEDVARLGTALTARKVNYRVFSTVVGLKQARWSQ